MGIILPSKYLILVGSCDLAIALNIATDNDKITQITPRMGIFNIVKVLNCCRWCCSTFKIYRQMMNTRYHPWNEVAHLFITGTRVGAIVLVSLSLSFSCLFLYLSLILSLFLTFSYSNDVLDPDFSRGSRFPRYARANVALSKITHLTRPVTHEFFKHQAKRIKHRAEQKILYILKQNQMFLVLDI